METFTFSSPTTPALPQGRFLSMVDDLAQKECISAEDLYAEMFSSAIARRARMQAARARWQELSTREQQVAALVCQDLTNRQIAARLSISGETVKTHIRNVLFKFGLHSKEDLRRHLADWDVSTWLTVELPAQAV